MKYTIEQLNRLYDLKLEEIITKIENKKIKKVLLQFPDGLKPYATAVVDYLEEKTNTMFLIWFGSCYGACDVPLLGKDLEKEIDLIIQFGHNDLMPSY